MKTVFITGGATGIGAASVKKFLQEDYQVSFMDIDSINAQKLIKNFSSFSLLYNEGNIRNRQDIHNAVEQTVKKFGGIDCIIANAGIHRSNNLLEITDEELDLMIDTNLKGTVNTLREAVPYLIKQGGGSIVINASDQCFIGKSNSFGYGLTKGALGQITRSLSIDLGPKNIRVNAVCAGTIRTPLSENAFQKLAEKNHTNDTSSYWEEEASLYSLGRVGNPEEVAEVIYFLASDAAGFVTGSWYAVDGGLTAR